MGLVSCDQPARFGKRKRYNEHGIHLILNKVSDSLRAVEPCKQHPGKMWVVQQTRMTPLLPFSPRQATLA